jgi:hypothetical protein
MNFQIKVGQQFDPEGMSNISLNKEKRAFPIGILQISERPKLKPNPKCHSLIEDPFGLIEQYFDGIDHGVLNKI